MYKVLLVEDDNELQTAIKNKIESWGNQVKVIDDFNNVLKEFITYNPQLVLLDIMLPFYNGYHWCEEIRKISNVPIIFISSASDDLNIIMGITQGADDFISKPIDLDVLNYKIQAVLRRTYELKGEITFVEFCGAILNLDTAILTFNNKKIELTKNEFKILKTLVDNKGKMVLRDTLMLKLWQDDIYVEENTLTVNVNRLRKSLKKIGLNDVIKTKNGIGYILNA